MVYHQVDYDLNVAMDKMIRKNFEETKTEKLDRLLEWILQNLYKFQTKDSSDKPLKCLSTDFVCFRGLLTELLCTPYESKEGWIICATKFRDTIYLCAYETPEKQSQRENATELQKTMSAWGYKFEQYMTDGSDPTKGVNENEEYCCVIRSRLESHSLVYGAEVDGADPSTYKTPHSDLKSFVELKTGKEPVQDRDYRALCRFKLMKWWSQSYLVGIPRVVCGFRNTDGKVHTLKTYDVEEMSSIAQDHWKPEIMLNFLNKFLEFVKTCVQVDDPEAVYKFQRECNGGDISCTYLGHDPQWAFMPKWYYEKAFSA
ncbi:decapping and exoribonuclease protein-like [Homarus americanus]|uniref:decapping and exoribonuclease protein-like n=1 Tax=Homarus americanus TaxID=6706 RepID=UPI001C454126|nr:decapping and exoribonuclease protein-like [Homarus americanus]